MAKVNFTAGRVEDFACPPGKTQAFMWDSKASGLALRVTANGARSYVFQGRLGSLSLRLTIGEPTVWSIAKAQAEARRLQTLLDQGKDPRIEKAAHTAIETSARAQKRTERMRLDVSGLDAWTAYCSDRKPQWSDRGYADHLRNAAAGGVKRKRASGKTIPGPLHSLLARPLATVTHETVMSWASREVRVRQGSAQLAFRLLRAFINWCAQHKDYRLIVDADACGGKKLRERLGKSSPKSDSLQREQLKPWFFEVRKDPNSVVAAYLQTLLLTGARREELMKLRWQDVDFQWKTILIGDKVEGGRVIPLTDHVRLLLTEIPRSNEWVFSSPTSKSGRLVSPTKNHLKAVSAAGLPHLTLHGLRRSFGTIAEWVECPVGVVAQIQGHKPSAIAEKHYRVRPIDLLRMWHQRIETFLCVEGGVA